MKRTFIIIIIFAVSLLGVQGLYGADFYVETAANGGDDTKTGTAEFPFATIRKAAQTAVNSGDVIHIGPGVFSEPNGMIKIHDGVNMFGSGIDVTIIESDFNPSGNYMANVLFMVFDGADAWNISAHGTHGNEFAWFTINGFEELGVAIDVRNRDNIHFHNLKITNCYYSALHVATDENNWGAGSSNYYPEVWNKNLKLHDLQIINGGGRVQYDQVYGSEAIKIGNIDGGELYNLYVEENQGGTLICSWNEGWNKNLSVFDSEFIITEPYGYPGHPEWGNYMNIEFKNPIGYHHIYNNVNSNVWWSFVSGLDYWGDAIYNPESDTENPQGVVLDFHDNETYLDNQAAYILALELGWGYSEVYQNFFHVAPDNPNKGTLYGISVTIRDINKFLVHHNVIDGFSSGVLISNDNSPGKTRKNVYITNNTIANCASYGLRLNAKKPLEDIFIKNNIFYSLDGPWGAHAAIFVKGDPLPYFTNVQITNNIHFEGDGQIIHYENSNAVARMIDPVIENNLEADPEFVLSGNQPFPFYELSSLASPAIDFGVDVGLGDFLGAAPDPGAVEMAASDPDIPITSLTIDQGDTLVLPYASSFGLTATVAPDDASFPDVYWSSRNDGVASVDRLTGLVVALAEGENYFIARTIEHTFTDSILVIVSYTHIESIEINEGNQTIDENTYFQFTTTIFPADADNTNVSWTSSNEEVASVNQSGEVYGISPGISVIKVITEDGALADSVNVTVNDVYVPVTGVSVNSNASGLFIGSTLQLTETVFPINADNQSVTWSSGNPSLATVDQNGLVTGVSEGTVVITVTAVEGGYTASETLSILPVPPNDLPWVEDFTGLADGTVENFGETAWNIVGNASNYLEVRNERLEGCRTYNQGVMLISESINIGGSSNVAISVDVSEIGSMEYQDYVKVYYRIDGGDQVLAGEVSNNLPGGEDNGVESDTITISVENIIGNTLEIMVEVLSNGGDEIWFVDNIKAISVSPLVSSPFIAQAGFQVKVYPNPSSNRNINVETEVGIRFDVQIHDITGNVCLYQPGCFDTTVLDLNGLKSGGYLLSIIFENQVVKSKLILQ